MHSEKKISLLNVLTGIDDGGLEMLVYRIYKGLDKLKYDLKMVSLTPLRGNFLEKQIRETGTELYSFNFRNKGKGIKDGLHNTWQYFLFIFFLWNTKFDVIHSHDFFPAFIARTGILLSQKKLFRRSIKVFSTYHNIYYWLKPVHHKINKFLSLFTKNIVCVSNTVKENYIKQENIKPEKLIVIRNGVNHLQFFPDNSLRNKTREDLGYKPDEIVIGCVAVITERKGQVFLLEAFKNLLKKHSKVRLLLVGGTREHEIEYYSNLLKIIKDNSIEQYVKFHPPVESVNPIYNAIDVFVLPSVTEGFGLSAFECMLTEKICLFSDLDVFKELTENGKIGFHFEGKNSESLFIELNKIIENFDDLSKKTPDYRNYVLNNYSESEMVKKYDHIYGSD